MTTKQDLRHAADRLIELHEAGDLDGVLALAAEVETEAATLGEQDEIARESLFVARFQRAIALTELDELAAAAEAYGEAADTPTDLDDPDQRHEVAMALLHRGMCLDAVGDASAAVDNYDEVERRFGGADDPVTRDQVLRARVNRAASLLGAGDAEAAAASADVLLGSIEPSASLDAEQWVLASRVRAAALVELGRSDEARRVLEAAADVEVDDEPVVEQQRLVAEDLEALEGS